MFPFNDSFKFSVVEGFAEIQYLTTLLGSSSAGSFCFSGFIPPPCCKSQNLGFQGRENHSWRWHIFNHSQRFIHGLRICKNRSLVKHFRFAGCCWEIVGPTFCFNLILRPVSKDTVYIPFKLPLCNQENSIRSTKFNETSPLAAVEFTFPSARQGSSGTPSIPLKILSSYCPWPMENVTSEPSSIPDTSHKIRLAIC